MGKLSLPILAQWDFFDSAHSSLVAAFGFLCIGFSSNSGKSVHFCRLGIVCIHLLVEFGRAERVFYTVLLNPLLKVRVTFSATCGSLYSGFAFLECWFLFHSLVLLLCNVEEVLRFFIAFLESAHPLSSSKNVTECICKGRGKTRAERHLAENGLISMCAAG